MNRDMLDPADPPSPLTAETIADAFHDALCPVSHHDSREVYEAAMGATQPCRVKYDRIAAAIASPAGLTSTDQLEAELRGSPVPYPTPAGLDVDHGHVIRHSHTGLPEHTHHVDERAATRPAEDAGEAAEGNPRDPYWDSEK